MKCLVPWRCSHDLPVTCACLDDSSSRTMPTSVTHTRGSLPYQYTNSLPAQAQASKSLLRSAPPQRTSTGRPAMCRVVSYSPYILDHST